MALDAHGSCDKRTRTLIYFKICNKSYMIGKITSGWMRHLITGYANDSEERH